MEVKDVFACVDKYMQGNYADAARLASPSTEVEKMMRAAPTPQPSPPADPDARAKALLAHVDRVMRSGYVGLAAENDGAKILDDLPPLPEKHPEISGRGVRLGPYVAELIARVGKLAEPVPGKSTVSAFSPAQQALLQRVSKRGDLHEFLRDRVLARVSDQTSNSRIFEVILNELARLSTAPPASLPTFLDKVRAVLS